MSYVRGVVIAPELSSVKLHLNDSIEIGKCGKVLFTLLGDKHSI